MSKKIAVFCDFDGTITEKDNIIAIMKKFAPPEWEALKDDILTERISIREGVGKLFSLLPSSKKEEISTYAIENVKIREGFSDFVKFLKEQNIPLFIVSGGIDFFVYPILQAYGPFSGVFCNASDFSGEYINILWPNTCDEYCQNDCGCCKPSIIRGLKEDFYKVVIGDSVTDLQAAKQADLVIARELLLEKSKEYGLNHREFVDFYDVIMHMSKVRSGLDWMSQLTERWEELADVKDELAVRDWFMGTSGNLAIKVSDNPLQFLVTASGKDKRKRTSEDFLLVDGNGKPVNETHLKPSAETLLHVEIYNKTAAGCSLHVHTIDNNIISELYGDQGEITFTGQELIKAFDLWEEDAVLHVPIISNPAHIPTLAQEFSEHVKEDKGVVLIRNHGITVWGKNAFEAKKLLEASEFLFRYHLRLLEYKK